MQSAAIFGTVGGVLGAVVVVLIVVVTAVMIVRKPNHLDETKQGTSHAYRYTDSSHC